MMCSMGWILHDVFSSVQLFGLLDKKSVIIKGIRYVSEGSCVRVHLHSTLAYLCTPLLVFAHSRECSWSPAGNMIAYWVPESNNIPAKITIMAVPSRAEISTKSRHLVKEVTMEAYKVFFFLSLIILQIK